MNIISKKAKIGNNVKFGNFVTVYDDVEIGDNCISLRPGLESPPPDFANQRGPGLWVLVLCCLVEFSLIIQLKRFRFNKKTVSHLIVETRIFFDLPAI